MTESGECRAMAWRCLAELRRRDLSEEGRALLKWLAAQWSLLAAERAILDGFGMRKQSRTRRLQ
jgi:hypothetical protein